MNAVPARLLAAKHHWTFSSPHKSALLPGSSFRRRLSVRFRPFAYIGAGSTVESADTGVRVPKQSLYSFAHTHLGKCAVSRPPAEIGLFSLLFVISMVVGSFLLMAIISLPTMSAFRRLAVSMERLSKVASEEVPGTLSSLKLSGMEINDLTDQLSSLRWSLSRIGKWKDIQSRFETQSLLSNQINLYFSYCTVLCVVSDPATTGCSIKQNFC